MNTKIKTVVSKKITEGKLNAKSESAVGFKITEREMKIKMIEIHFDICRYNT